MTWGALLAMMVTLVGCGGTSLRRPLVTDETPLGTPRERVLAWHAANGWCRDDAPHPATEVLRPCTGPDRYRIWTMLAFSSAEELVSATVTVTVPPPDPPQPRLIGSGTVSRHSTSRDVAISILDALAAELTARHGAPDRSTWTERRWLTDEELIRLEWKEIMEGTFIVTEEHSVPGLTSDLRVLR